MKPIERYNTGRPDRPFPVFDCVIEMEEFGFYPYHCAVADFIPMRFFEGAFDKRGLWHPDWLRVMVDSAETKVISDQIWQQAIRHSIFELGSDINMGRDWHLFGLMKGDQDYYLNYRHYPEMKIIDELPDFVLKKAFAAAHPRGHSAIDASFQSSDAPKYIALYNKYLSEGVKPLTETELYILNHQMVKEVCNQELTPKDQLTLL